MNTRKEIIKSICAIAVLPALAKTPLENSTTNDNSSVLEKWAKKHAMIYALNYVSEKTYVDGHGNNYVSVWPVAFALFKLQNSGELCKMIIEFPANVRRANMPCNPTKADFDKARWQIYTQLKSFMIEYAKEKMSAHPEITVYA